MRYLTLAAAAAAALTTGGAQAATITFDGFTSGTSYSEAGATITAAGQTFIGQNGPGGSNSILANGTPRAEFTALFAGTTGFVSVDLGDFNADSDLLFLEAFDAGNNLLGTQTLLIDASDSVMHTLSLSLAGISSVKFGARAPAINGNSVYADNLTFRLAGNAVPEPSAWALLILGFGVVGATLRTQKRGLAFA